MLKRFISKILIVFFNLLYDQFAWAYDWVADVVSIGRWKTWVISVIPYLGDGMVLELGCGPGHLQNAYSPAAGAIFGLDTSMSMLSQAKKNLEKPIRDNNLILAMAQELPFQDESFPVIVSTFPSNYIYDQETLKQVWRVLQDDGQLIILPAAWITGDNILDRLAGWLFTVTGESPGFDDRDLETGVSRQFDKVSRAGFRVIQQLIESDRSHVLLVRAIKSRSNRS